MDLTISFAATGLNPQPRQAHMLTAIKAINAHEKEFFTSHQNAITAVGAAEGVVAAVAFTACLRISNPNLLAAACGVLALGMAAVTTDTVYSAIPPSPNEASACYYFLSVLGGYVGAATISGLSRSHKRSVAPQINSP